jgi:nitroimidazol reductase NimA-like FMN-containing flavoprotein (pyridoxamine 5'-phosphate oxidase superfamily)
MSSYPISDKNEVRRVAKRGHYDRKTVHEILDAARHCHLGFTVDGQPFVIPTLFGREGDKLYVHGAVQSRMLVHLEQAPQACLTVTHIDGLVLARSAFHHSMNYRSAVVFGKLKKIEADSAKNHALKIISDHLLPGRWEECREPSANELKATTVLEMEIEQASAKIREGGPVDAPADYKLPIWAGVLPYHITLGEPVADEQLSPEIPLCESVKRYFQ